jgi:hypothetical protein
MWLDGILPKRNPAEERAVRYPIWFTCTPKKGQRQFLPILDDIAGEALFGDMAQNKNFPHLPSTSDAIFFMPADDLAIGALEAFLTQLTLVRTEGRSIDLKKINLIFVISKIDQLKHARAKEHQELLRLILPRPYSFPGGQDEEDLSRYMKELEEVHFGIEYWLGNNLPEVKTFTDFFGSVRYCGLSAFGFQPKQESLGFEAEYTLPFRPTPVRALDPVFWLFKENRLIDF